MVVHVPSKKIFFLIIACAVGVSAIGAAVYATKNTAGQDKKARDSSLIYGGDSKTMDIIEQTLKNNSTADSDQDGLLNWEETLWGTDANNSDSDGDKTKDGEEVKLSRNPAKAGPDDKLSTTVSGQGTVKKAAPLENTQTAKLSRELFANYMEAKRLGVPLNAGIQNQIIQQTFSDKSLGLSAKRYSVADIKVAATSATSGGVVLVSDVKKYGNDLGKAILAGSSSATGPAQSSASEIEILFAAITEEKPEEISKLAPIVRDYTVTLNQLAQVEVPKDLLGYHLELLNNMSRLLTDIKSFQLIFDDPMVGLVGINNYYPDLEAMTNSIKRIKIFFDGKEISFEPSEPGFAFVRAVK